jgi:hypothetical protein
LVEVVEPVEEALAASLVVVLSRRPSVVVCRVLPERAVLLTPKCVRDRSMSDESNDVLVMADRSITGALIRRCRSISTNRASRADAKFTDLKGTATILSASTPPDTSTETTDWDPGSMTRYEIWPASAPSEVCRIRSS